MSQPGDQPMDTSSGVAVTISSELMIAVVIFLFVVVVFIFFLYLYAKHYMGSNPRSRARVIFAASDQIPLPSQGLDAELLKALPITVVRQADFKDGLECAVCLSELFEGEEARLLPKCNHGFHVECIDMWFHSHSTCPVCRTPVSSEPIGIPNSGTESLESSHLEAAETPNFPTNVLFWGTQDQVSTGGPQEGTSSSSGNPLGSSSSGKKPEGMLVIEIPRRVAEGFPSLISPLPTGRFPVEEMKSPMEEMKTPKSARLRSLRRLLSQGKRVIGSSCSPREGDIEQGVIGASGDGSVLAPKTPTS